VSTERSFPPRTAFGAGATICFFPLPQQTLGGAQTAKTNRALGDRSLIFTGSLGSCKCMHKQKDIYRTSILFLSGFGFTSELNN